MPHAPTTEELALKRSRVRRVPVDSREWIDGLLVPEWASVKWLMPLSDVRHFIKQHNLPIVQFKTHWYITNDTIRQGLEVLKRGT